VQAQSELGTPLGTADYSALWLVAGVLLLASVPLLGEMRPEPTRGSPVPQGTGE